MVDVTVNRSALVELASLAVAATDQKSTLPYGTHVRLTAEGSVLRAEASSAFASMNASRDAHVESGGAVVVGAKALLTIASKLPDEKIRIQMPDPAHALIRGGGGKYKLPLATDELPDPLTVDMKPIYVDGSELSSLLSRVACAVGRDGSRPMLEVVHVEIGTTRMRCLATDGHRMHIAEARSGQESDYVFDLPSARLSEVMRFIDGKEVALAYGSNRLVLTAAGDALHVVAPEAQFIERYERFIPTEAKSTSTVHSGRLVDALKRMSLVGSDPKEGTTVELHFGDAQLRITLDSNLTGKVAGGEELVPCEIAGLPPSVCVSAEYLADAIIKAPHDNVDLIVNGAMQPVLVRCEGYLAIVLPRRK